MQAKVPCMLGETRLRAIFYLYQTRVWWFQSKLAHPVSVPNGGFLCNEQGDWYHLGGRQFTDFFFLLLNFMESFLSWS